MSFYEKFWARVDGIRIILSYQYRFGERTLTVKITDLREDREKQQAERIPVFYQYHEPTSERPYPVIRVIAAPGVSISLDGFPFRYSPSMFFPDVDIIRVQDPELVPTMGFDYQTHNLLQEYDANNPRMGFAPSNERLDWRNQLMPDDFISVVPMNDGVVLRHHLTRQDLIIKVPLRSADPAFLDNDRGSPDYAAKFLFQVNRGGVVGALRHKPGGKLPVVEIVKTPAVRVTLARQPKDYSLFSFKPSASLSGVFFQVYETQSMGDVPHPGEEFDAVQSSWKRVTTAIEVDQPVVISTALTVVDFASRFIPGIGDVIDIAEFAKGLQTGRDFYGRKLSQTDLVLMGVGVLLPFATSGAMRVGKMMRKVFGRKARKAGELLDELRLTKDESRLIREVEELLKQRANIPIAKLQDYVALLEKLKLKPPTVDLLLNVEQTGFVQADIQAAYRRHLKTENPKGAREWALTTRNPEANALFKGILGPDFVRQSKKLPAPREVNAFEVPRPANLSDEVADGILETVQKNPAKLTERLAHVLPEDFVGLDMKGLRLAQFSKPFITLGHFNILKGNMAEILSHDIKLRHLDAVRKIHKDAFLIGDLRIQLMVGGKLQPGKLFSDGAIARMNGGDLELLEVFEVKAGFKGGQEAQKQIFDWIEDRLTDAEGSRLIIAKGSELTHGRGTVSRMRTDQAFLYDPGSRKKGRVIGLNSAGRVMITPQGASHLGINSADRVATDVVREELQVSARDITRASFKALESAGKAAPPIFIEELPKVSSAQLDYLVAHLLGKLAAKATRAAASQEASVATQ